VNSVIRGLEKKGEIQALLSARPEVNLVAALPEVKMDSRPNHVGHLGIHHNYSFATQGLLEPMNSGNNSLKLPQIN